MWIFKILNIPSTEQSKHFLWLQCVNILWHTVLFGKVNFRFRTCRTFSSLSPSLHHKVSTENNHRKFEKIKDEYSKYRMFQFGEFVTAMFFNDFRRILRNFELIHRFIFFTPDTCKLPLGGRQSLQYTQEPWSTFQFASAPSEERQSVHALNANAPSTFNWMRKSKSQFFGFSAKNLSFFL